MIFPDCRNDENYNERFLDLYDKRFIKGMDYALDVIKNLIEYNLEFYEDELTNVHKKGETYCEDEVYVSRRDFFDILEENRKAVTAVIEDCLECERNEVIVSMIENMDDDKYEKNKAEVLKNDPDLKLYDTRSFFYNTKGAMKAGKSGEMCCK